MNDQDRFRLLFGPYEAPLFEYGQIVRCAVRGDVIVCGLSKGPIPWPIGKHHDGARARFLIITGDLEKAIEREAVMVVAHWWGVSRGCVGDWRKAMGLSGETEGTRHLWERNAQLPGVQAGLEKAMAKANDPVRRAKRVPILGWRHSPETRRKLSEAHKGKTLTEEHRRNISKTQREIKENIWTSEEDELVRTLKAAKVVERTGRVSRALKAAQKRALGWGAAPAVDRANWHIL